MFLTRSLLVLLLALPVFTSASELSGAHPYLKTRHTLGVGASYQKSDSEIRASRQGLPEIKVDLENLGVDDTDTSWMLEYRWRFAENWMLVGVAYTFDESGDRTVERDFNFDGKEFKAGAAVDTSIEIDTYILDVLYSVYRTDRAELMLGGGIHAIDFEAAIQGQAFVGDLEAQTAKASSDVLAPLPNLRAQGFYAINDKWGVGGVVGWLSANYDDYDGSFAYIHARLAYALSTHFSVSMGYQFSDVELTYTPSSVKETELEVQFSGPTLLLNYRF